MGISSCIDGIRILKLVPINEDGADVAGMYEDDNAVELYVAF